MSVPYIAWAFQQRDLTAAQKLVLIALCDRANGERVCFPSFPKIAADCELSLRAVYCAVRHLCDVRGLVTKVTDKQERSEILSRCGARLGTLSNVYRILRPADGSNGHDQTPAKYARVEQEDSPTPANPARVTPAKYAGVSPETPAQNAGLPLQNNHQTPAKYAPEPSKEPLREPKTRASARGSEGLKSFGKEGAAEEPVPTPAQIEARRKAAAADLAALPGRLGGMLAKLGKSLRTDPPPFTPSLAYQRSALEPVYPKLQPQDPIRSPEQMIAEAMGIPLAEAAALIASKQAVA